MAQTIETDGPDRWEIEQQNEGRQTTIAYLISSRDNMSKQERYDSCINDHLLVL
jgi:hypothetical protein